MSKEYYKKKLIDLRADIAKEKEAKKRDNENYSRWIKSADRKSTRLNSSHSTRSRMPSSA